MRLSHCARTKIALLVLILSMLIPNVVLLRDQIKRYQVSVMADKITLFEERFADLRKALPKRGVIGYFTDRQADEGVNEYFLTQYTLSPLIVVSGTEYPLVVGNFHKILDIDEIAKDYDLRLLKDFGNGVALFGKGNAD